MSAHLLAVDLGTSSVKAAIFDAEGAVVAMCGEVIDTAYGPGGVAEQDPEAWWSACTVLIEALLTQVQARSIAAVCVTGHAPALVCLDASGVCIRPAPIWLDRRAETERAEIAATLGHDRFSNLLHWLLWLKKREPERLARIHRPLQSYEFINYRLTGEVAAIHLRKDRAPWDRTHLAALGLDERLIPNRAVFPGEVLGQISPSAAAACGLPAGVPVVAGTVDAFCAWIGTGVTRPGLICNTTGTSNTLALAWPEAVADPAGRFSAMPNPGAGNWILTGQTSAGGPLMDWVRTRVFAEGGRAFERIGAEAARVPPGADGLVVLPYLAGERAPHFDPLARGVFFGLAPDHDRGHIARAALESVAFACRDVLAAIGEAGAVGKEIRIAGGAAHNAVWNRIKADVLGLPVVVPAVTDSSLLGAAILAAWGAGIHRELAHAVAAMTRIADRIEPDAAVHRRYTGLFEIYRRLYRHLRDEFQALADWRDADTTG